MEELQDAIEDAQYVTAISTYGGPNPTSKWVVPLENELAEWRQRKIEESAENEYAAFSMEWFLSQSIGLFLFSQYTKTTYDDYERLNFIEDVIRYKELKEKHRSEKARRIFKYYLTPKKEEDKRRSKEIDEFDLRRKKPSYMQISKEKIKTMVAQNIKDETTMSTIGVEGPLIKETKQNLLAVEKKLDKENHAIPDFDIFDSLEAIVLDTLKTKYWSNFQHSKDYERCIQFLWYQDREVVEDDFFKIRVLGRGGFGLVSGCRKCTSGKLYAMKVMNKKRIKIKQSQQLALNELMVLSATNSPFVVNLKYSFQSRDDVFLILDLMTGGDLSFHLNQKGFFQKDECIYYAARIMLGLQALHDRKFVYRDLKPENCLLAEDGRMKLTDLGLACKITPTLHGAAGTRGYWAPEMLLRDENGKRMVYGHSVDWFSFGCVLAELISGVNPYRSEAAVNFGKENGKKTTKEKAIDYSIVHMQPSLDSPLFEPDAKDLCLKLLEKDPKIRIGANGCEEIMAHPWFKDENWEKITDDRGKPPFVPAKDVNALSQRDIGHFAEDKVFQETSLDEKDELVYKNWNWTNPLAYSREVIEFLIYERESGSPLLPKSSSDACCCVVS